MGAETLATTLLRYELCAKVATKMPQKSHGKLVRMLTYHSGNIIYLSKVSATYTTFRGKFVNDQIRGY